MNPGFPFRERANNTPKAEFHLFTMHWHNRSTLRITITHLKQFNHKATTLGSLINKHAAASIAFTSSISRYIDHPAGC